MKNKWTAIILAIFLWWIWVHQFYLNRAGKWIFYLLFFWTFIPAFIALIDIILLLIMSEETFNNKYNSLFMEIIKQWKKSTTND